MRKASPLIDESRTSPYAPAMKTTDAAGVGDVIAGRYLLEELIGEGATASVYRATHTQTGRKHALKLAHANLIRSPGFADKFLKEARVGNHIGKCDYIVKVYDAQTDDARGIPYIAMELLEGESLDRGSEAEPMDADLVKVLYRQLGEALDQAHAKKIIHRDLKPANLFLTRGRKGEVVLKILDFGIAKNIELNAAHTMTQLAGTPAYGAPEQFGHSFPPRPTVPGERIASSVSAATDVWAMGLIAYELLTGLKALQYWNVNSLVELIAKNALAEPETATVRAGNRAHLLPAGFDSWFARCLRRNPTERWQSAGIAASELIAVLGGGIGHAQPSTMSRPASPPHNMLTRARVFVPTPPGSPLSPHQPPLPTDTSLTGANTRPPIREKHLAGAIVVATLSAIAVVSIAVFLLLPKNGRLAAQPSIRVAPTAEDSEQRELAPPPTIDSTTPAPPLPSVVQDDLPSPQKKTLIVPTAPSVAPPSNRSTQAVSTGTLNLNSTPASKVVLDGRPLGSTPKIGVSVAEGPHTVTYIHPTLGKKTVSVTVKAGETKGAATRFQ